MPELTAGLVQMAIAFLTGAGVSTIYLGLLWVATRALARPGGTVAFALLALARALLVAGVIATAFMMAIPSIVIATGGLSFIITRIVITRAASQGATDA